MKKFRTDSKFIIALLPVIRRFLSINFLFKPPLNFPRRHGILLSLIPDSIYLKSTISFQLQWKKHRHFMPRRATVGRRPPSQPISQDVSSNSSSEPLPRAHQLLRLLENDSVTTRDLPWPMSTDGSPSVDKARKLFSLSLTMTGMDYCDPDSRSCQRRTILNVRDITLTGNSTFTLEEAVVTAGGNAVGPGQDTLEFQRRFPYATKQNGTETDLSLRNCLESRLGVNVRYIPRQDRNQGFLSERQGIFRRRSHRSIESLPFVSWSTKCR